MTNSPAERVAAEVRGELARQRKTQAALSEALGMSQQAVSRRLAGAIPFDVNELDNVAIFLDVPIADFFIYPPSRDAVA